ncbi:unnamed protein product [Urochloa decumbens]|uniref:Peptidase C1A papain C-terminal domain-containing protein n=1 Tax=Urochloa decumbens TaxID=240449 RepID=A0ABC9EMD1_9POAL
MAAAPASSDTIASSSGEATSVPAWMKAMTLLEKIRTLIPRAFRPYYPRTVERGTRSAKEAKSWTCKVCNYENKPTQHLLFDLPATICEECCFPPHEGATDFDFCFADLGMNDFCPIGHVKKQIGNTCIAYTIASAVEVTHRVMMILLGEEEALTKYGPFINVDDLLKKYAKRCSGKGCEVGSITYGAHSVIDMLSIMRSDGVMGLENGCVHKIADWAYISADDFTAIITALANGYPLIAGFYCGKRVGQLRPGEIYVPPEMDSVSESGQRPVGHAVLLVGARQEGAEQIVYFLSSSGEWFCQRCNEGDRIRGGIGAIRNKDLCLPPIQILRFNESHTQMIL